MKGSTAFLIFFGIVFVSLSAAIMLPVSSAHEGEHCETLRAAHSGVTASGMFLTLGDQYKDLDHDKIVKAAEAYQSQLDKAQKDGAPAAMAAVCLDSRNTTIYTVNGEPLND